MDPSDRTRVSKQSAAALLLSFSFSFSFVFSFSFGRLIGLHSRGTLTYYGSSMKLRLVLQSKGSKQFLSPLMKTSVNCVCG